MTSLQAHQAIQDLRCQHGLPVPYTFSTRRAGFSLHLLRFQDQQHPVTARFFQMPFAKDVFLSLPLHEAALLFQPLRLLPTPYHPISGIHRLVN